MDAFYASVEQRDNPQLRGKPVVVAWRRNRSVVCAASYEARAFGVRSAMPAMHAEKLCPDAIFVAPDFTRYRAVSREVREIFKRHTDLIEPLSLDEAYLDVTENKMRLPRATLAARTIREQIRQELNLTGSAGVAPNKFLAKLASDWRKPDGLFVISLKTLIRFFCRCRLDACLEWESNRGEAGETSRADYSRFAKPGSVSPRRSLWAIRCAPVRTRSR
jgi:DNA polymerase-4